MNLETASVPQRLPRQTEMALSRAAVSFSGFELVGTGAQPTAANANNANNAT